MDKKIVPIRLIFSYFWPHINKYKKAFYVIFIGYGLSYFLGGIVKPLLYKDLMDVIAKSGTKSGLVATNGAFWLIGAIITLMITQTILHRSIDYVMSYFQSRVMKELSDFTFKKIHDHSYQFFVDNFQGSIVAKSRRFIRSFETLHDHASFTFLRVIIQLSGIFVVLFVTAYQIAMFFALWSVVFVALMSLLVKKKRAYDLRSAAADSKTTGGLADAITGFLNIKMFSSMVREIGIFQKITDHEEKMRSASWNFSNLIMVIHSAIWLVLEGVGMYLVVRSWSKGLASAGTLMLVQTYFMTIGSIMWELRGAVINSMAAISDASEMIEIFEQEPAISDPVNPEPFMAVEGEIVFDNARFSYGEKVSVFEGLNLKIESGQKVGLVGPSGAGKTTITKLLLRFVDLIGGRILIDGQDISKVKQDDLRNKIAYVPQDPVLFHRSLRDNIAYGRPDATDDEILEVAKKANAHEFISRLSEGYDTFVGERGIKLSGGERQRIAIARAMLKNSPILILDEATSSLDAASEISVQEAFARLMEDKTVLVIAHRLSTIRKMDRIIVLDEGYISEDGSHDELMNQKGLYCSLWTHQAGGFVF